MLARPADFTEPDPQVQSTKVLNSLATQSQQSSTQLSDKLDWQDNQLQQRRDK
jgi:hypothetical protein